MINLWRNVFKPMVIFLLLPWLFAQSALNPEEERIRQRNLGWAQYENEAYPEAAEHFYNSVKLAPQSVVDRINMAVCLIHARSHEKAIETLLEVARLDPSYPHIAYLLGIVYLRLNDLEKAKTAFESLLRIDPLCVPAHYNLGVILKKLKSTDEAINAWNETIRLDPDHGSAYFQLFNVYNARHDVDRAQRAFREYTRTKEKKLGPGTTAADLEKSRYFTLIMEKATATKHSKEIPVTLRDATQEVGLSNATSALSAKFADPDDDGDLDLLLGSVLYRNDHGYFVAITPSTGSMLSEQIFSSDFGDFDNDGRLDLLVGSSTQVMLYRGKEDHTFENVSDRAGLVTVCGTTPPSVLRFVDIDHEGDLDIIVGCGEKDKPASNRLFRNNGNGTFLDISDSSHIAKTSGFTRSILLADFDGKNDIDLFFGNGTGLHSLYMNLRDGSFEESAKLAGLQDVGPITNARSGDLNQDGLSDIVMIYGMKKPVEVWLNRGEGRFYRDEASPVLKGVTRILQPNTGILADIDNDGDLDLVLAGGQGKRGMALFRNDGSGGWIDATDLVLPASLSGSDVFDILAGDVDNDGDQDLLFITPDKGVTFLRNEGGNQNASIRLRLKGRKNNPDGYGAKVWVKQGAFFLLRETFERWIDIGVGKRDILDVVGLRWPTGVTQNQIDVRTSEKAPIEFQERPGLAESCPFVYAYNGQTFGFVTDLLDTTPLGIQLMPGVPFAPNHREAVLISGEALKPKDGFLSIRITQELKEITYLDQVRLYGVDHPANAVVAPNDRFSSPPFAPFAIHTMIPILPRIAQNEQGEDILPALLHPDRIYPFDCPPIAPRYPGITKPHALILDPGDLKGTQEIYLFLRGTTLWTDASVNFAVAQNPDLPIYPVSLDIIGKDGQWVRLKDDIGLPAGMDKILPVDLSDAFQSEDFRVRISTNLALLWDQAFFAVERSSSSVTELSPLFADLHDRGFSQTISPDGKLPDLFLYEKLMPIPPFDEVHEGSYTRYGDVVELLRQADDRYVILAPGDEIAIEFPDALLPELPEGWKRDYILDANGWIKDGDWRTLSGNTVAPLPFHAMPVYPYPSQDDPWAHPDHQRYLERYQTRFLGKTF